MHTHHVYITLSPSVTSFIIQLSASHIDACLLYIKTRKQCRTDLTILTDKNKIRDTKV